MKQRRRGGWIMVVVFAAAVIFLSVLKGSARAEEKPFLKCLAAGWKAWTEIRNDVQGLKANFSAGYISDSSTDKSLDRLDIGAMLAMGSYPNEFHFDMASSVQLKKAKGRTDFFENVTTLRLNYNRNFFPFLQAYAFVERFSDSYLSIQQRYETGLGVKLETEFGLTSKGRERILEVKKFQHALACARNQPEKTDAPGMEIDKQQIKDVLTAVRKKHAILAIGLAFTALAEYERAELELDDGSRTLLDPTRRSRISIRPSLTFQPVEGLYFKWQTYFKLPLFGPTDGVAFDGSRRYDLRTDTFTSLRYNLPAAPASPLKVFLTVEYNRFTDRLPPYVAQIKTAAADHRYLSFKLGVEF